VYYRFMKAYNKLHWLTYHLLQAQCTLYTSIILTHRHDATLSSVDYWTYLIAAIPYNVECYPSNRPVSYKQ